MPDFNLEPHSPLGGYAREFGAVTLNELRDLALVSIAAPAGGRDEMARAIETAFGIALPDVGTSSYSAERNVRLLGLQRDQMFVAFEHRGDNAIDIVRKQLGDVGFYTDQSDSWVKLRIAGPGCRHALERICMLDLGPSAFAVGATARTTMEHLAVIIVRDASDAFLLLSPRSSAASFLNAVETSIGNAH